MKVKPVSRVRDAFFGRFIRPNLLVSVDLTDEGGETNDFANDAFLARKFGWALVNERHGALFVSLTNNGMKEWSRRNAIPWTPASTKGYGRLAV